MMQRIPSYKAPTSAEIRLYQDAAFCNSVNKGIDTVVIGTIVESDDSSDWED